MGGDDNTRWGFGFGVEAFDGQGSTGEDVAVELVRRLASKEGADKALGAFGGPTTAWVEEGPPLGKRFRGPTSSAEDDWAQGEKVVVWAKLSGGRHRGEGKGLERIGTRGPLAVVRGGSGVGGALLAMMLDQAATDTGWHASSLGRRFVPVGGEAGW